jgi:CBS domain containing-hemolysin-like protein
MARGQKSRIIVVDEQGKPVGVISLSDIAKREDGAQAAQTLRKVSDREVRA